MVSLATLLLKVSTEIIISGKYCNNKSSKELVFPDTTGFFITDKKDVMGFHYCGSNKISLGINIENVDPYEEDRWRDFWVENKYKEDENYCS